MNHDFSRQKLLYLLPLLGIGILFFVYLLNATSSPLWYDEAIEYYFSSVLDGAVPGGRDTFSMYERICSTFQPPLYNWLMFLWLSVSDSEMWFRLAGIIATFVGAIGFYRALSQTTSQYYSALGCLLYLSVFKISYYALECAEYNLMLCMLAWTLFFYVSYLERKNLKSLIGFFVFAVLSVYSQYGAAFCVAALYISILLDNCFEKNKKELKSQIVISVIVLLAAVFPLLFLFLIKQLNHQGTSAIKHIAYFANGNCLKDFLLCLYSVFFDSFNLNFGATIGKLVGHAVPSVLAMCIVVSIVVTRRRLQLHLLLSCVLGWLFYYIAVAYSYYGYNGWNASNLGTMNIGGRYALFLIPLWIYFLLYGGYCFKSLLDKKTDRLYIFFVSVLIFTYSILGMFAIQNLASKDDVRDVVEALTLEENANQPILVHQWCDANFQFYLNHKKNRIQQNEDSIVTADTWIRTADKDKMEEMLNSMGVFQWDSFYYVGPVQSYHDSYLNFTDVMKDKGYTITEKYVGLSTLLYLKK